MDATKEYTIGQMLEITEGPYVGHFSSASKIEPSRVFLAGAGWVPAENVRARHSGRGLAQ